MALENTSAGRLRTVGYVSRQPTVAVDERVEEILARREVAVRQARLAAQQLEPRMGRVAPTSGGS